MDFSVQATNLGKSYGKFSALDDISFSVEPGSKVLLLGANGAGKTTIIRCMMGLVSYRGELRVGGIDVRKESRKAREIIGYVPQEFSLYDDLSVYSQGKFVSKFRNCPEEEIKQKFELQGIWYAKDKLVKSLSRGMKQRLAIALASMGDPPILIFDEPTAAVDLSGQLDFQAMMKKTETEKKTLIIATHQPGLSDFANQVIVLNRGKIVANGSPSQLLSQIDSKDVVFLKIDDQDFPKASEEVSKQKGEVIEFKGGWLKIAVTSDTKSSLIQAMNSQKILIHDMVMERSTIESKYLGFVGNGDAA